MARKTTFEYVVEAMAIAAALLRLLALALSANTRTINMWFSTILAAVLVAFGAFNLFVVPRRSF